MVPLSALVNLPLNVRTIRIRRRASGKWLTPFVVGLIQNPGGSHAAGRPVGRRSGRSSSGGLQLYANASSASMPASGHREACQRRTGSSGLMVENKQPAMHPAEQISGFRTLSEQGKTPAQIGDQLGTVRATSSAC